MAQLTTATELVGGFAVILGAFVAIVSLPMAAVLLVAMFTVHLPYGFSAIKLIGVTAAGAQFGPPGYEVDLLYVACLATLVMGGAGPATDEMGGPQPDEQSTDVMGGSGPATDEMGGPEPDEQGTDLMGGA